MGIVPKGAFPSGFVPDGAVPKRVLCRRVRSHQGSCPTVQCPRGCCAEGCVPIRVRARRCSPQCLWRKSPFLCASGRGETLAPEQILGCMKNHQKRTKTSTCIISHHENTAKCLYFSTFRFSKNRKIQNPKIQNQIMSIIVRR